MATPEYLGQLGIKGCESRTIGIFGKSDKENVGVIGKIQGMGSP
jgi:hypothetical protein